jgi:hypothetical protein
VVAAVEVLEQMAVLAAERMVQAVEAQPIAVVAVREAAAQAVLES